LALGAKFDLVFYTACAVIKESARRGAYKKSRRTLNAKEVFMKKKSFFTGMLAMAMVFGLVLAGCSESSALVGKWSAESRTAGWRFYSSLELLKDGTGRSLSITLTWTAKNGRLTISDGWGTDGYNYTMSGSILTLTDSNGIFIARLKKL
jgi:hypothetical protein